MGMASHDSDAVVVVLCTWQWLLVACASRQCESDRQYLPSKTSIKCRLVNRLVCFNLSGNILVMIKNYV